MVDIELGNMEIHIGHVIMFFSALKRFFDCTWSSAWFGGSILPVASAFWGQRATCGSPSFGDLFLFPLMAWTHWLTFASFATMVAHILPSFTINYHH